MGGEDKVVFDMRDFGVLRLCGLCRYIPVRLMKRFGSPFFEPQVLVTLRNHKLIKLQSDLQSYKLTQGGKEVLDEFDCMYSEDARMNIKREAYRRKLNASLFVITLFLAEIDVFFKSVHTLANAECGFVSSLVIRQENNGKVLAGARFLGILKIRETVFVPYHIKDKNEWIIPHFEKETFTSQTSAMRNIKNVEIILAGNSLEELWRNVHTIKKSVPEQNGLMRFDIALEEMGCDYLLLPLNELGVMQMNVMKIWGYREKIVSALGFDTICEKELSECDGMSKESPVIVSMDFNVKRISRALKQCGRYKPHAVPKIICFSFQEKTMFALLKRVNAGKTSVIAIDNEGISKIFPEVLHNYEPFDIPHGKEGNAVDASERHIRKDDVEISEDYKDIL